MGGLPSATRMAILNEMHHGALTLGHADSKFRSFFGRDDDHILTLLAGLRPDQQQRMANAYAKNGTFPDDVGAMVADRIKEITGHPRISERLRDQIIHDSDIGFAEINKMMAAPKLQRLTESCYHKLVEAWHSKKLLIPTADGSKLKLPVGVEDFLDPREVSGIFLVQHDWAAAFDKARDYHEGDIKFPYPNSIFEFRISGHRTCVTLVTAGHDDQDEKDMKRAAIICAETSVGWVLLGMYDVMPDGWVFGPARYEPALAKNVLLSTELIKLLEAQIRAICIALDAEVATTEIQRAPYRLNQKREKAGKLPLFDYHVVHLANRHRVAPRLAEAGDLETEHARRRLHFVRAHDRHYANHTARIQWHLRGDPDLGFIDKEYRL